ncbi:ABC transporter permease [Mucilaginibacter myungsuensis]|uniref:ABC transporter permease n=1 Tax=Mucilaginibacter myungsuensis TaxID=649104 RepID=A0A929PV58_9SPHI|nr:ABC transporter permease [Mucilaginibacter myungsuensis]MBE9660651.1 ABC transporter permease [Mucilaginibacter myungsuensis]MDN3600696.1 ABC transporter permease [Mucilaginibacter myungsuensis]
MFKTYFKTAWRYLLNNKVTTLISVSGLAVGICCFLLLATYLLNELRYDRFHANADRIVRVGYHYQNANDAASNDMAITPTAVVPVFKKEFTEVEDGVRVYDYSGGSPATIKYGENVLSERNILLADDSFFKIFTFNFIAGRAQTALAEPNSVVLTASAAKKYFGNDEPMGKVLIVNKINMVVGGVIEDVPAYSQIKFDMMGNYQIAERSKNLRWDSANDFSYFLLKPGANADALGKKMSIYLSNLLKIDPKSDDKVWFTLEGLTSVHLYSKLSDGLEAAGNINYVYILGAVAVILLVLACINFLNLVTAKAAERAHEIGVRKVMGAVRKQLFIQFITEAGLITFFSLAIGLLLVGASFGSFSTFTAQKMGFETWHASWLVGFIAVLFVVVTFTAGTYPALYLSAFNPVSTLKGKGNNKQGSGLRKGLVVFQFTVSVFFVICTIVVGSQLHHIQSMDTGINRSQVLVLDIGGMPYTRIEPFKAALTGQSGVASVSASYDSPVNVSGGYSINEAEGKTGNFNLSVTAIPVEKDFARTVGIKIIQGRGFNLTDEKLVTVADEKQKTHGFIINETAAKALGWKPDIAVGKRISLNGRVGNIAGVAKDFNFVSLHEQIGPIVVFTDYSWFGKILIKTSAGNTANTLAEIQTEWKKFYPGKPFDYHFLDAEFDAMYKAESRTASILNMFTGVTIFISCLGLFGLAVFTTKQRFKEVSIRKVMGASVVSIVQLISSDFLKLVFFAVLIASPLAWIVMDNWLQNFAYRINVQWWVFVVAGFAAILIAFLTVGIQSIKAALLNPVKNLRNE